MDRFVILFKLFVGAIVVPLMFLSGCQSTEEAFTNKPQPVPKIFSRFEPNNQAHQPEKETIAALHKKNKIKLSPQPLSPSDHSTKQPNSDLWLHIANNLNMPIYLNRTLKKRIAWYAKQPDYLRIVNNRAAPYLFHIVNKIERRNLPMELALLPFVESDFRPTVSSSQQAVGVWQLVGATAHHFGVQSDQWYDGRKDVLAATDAALAYLEYLHKRFDGNWLHALAAYNSGEGRVKQAIANNKTKGKATDYWSLKLPRETADYVPKLLALSYLVQHPNKGLKRPVLDNKAITTEFNVGQQFDFTVLAKLSGIGRKQLHALNTGYLKNQSSPNGPHTLLLPIAQQTLLRSAFFKSNFAGEYIVKQDDTLYAIARRYDISVKALKVANSKSNNIIKVGEKLKVGEPKMLPKNLLIDYQISPYLEQKEIVVPTIAVNYQVKSGDSLWSISQLYDVPHKDLAKWNNMTASSILKPGTQLVLYLPQATPSHQHSDNESLLSELENSLINVN